MKYRKLSTSQSNSSKRRTVRGFSQGPKFKCLRRRIKYFWLTVRSINKNIRSRRICSKRNRWCKTIAGMSSRFRAFLRVILAKVFNNRRITRLMKAALMAIGLLVERQIQKAVAKIFNYSPKLKASSKIPSLPTRKTTNQ